MSAADGFDTSRHSLYGCGVTMPFMLTSTYHDEKRRAEAALQELRAQAGPVRFTPEQITKLEAASLLRYNTRIQTLLLSNITEPGYEIAAATSLLMGVEADLQAYIKYLNQALTDQSLLLDQKSKTTILEVIGFLTIGNRKIQALITLFRKFKQADNDAYAITKDLAAEQSTDIQKPLKDIVTTLKDALTVLTAAGILGSAYEELFTLHIEAASSIITKEAEARHVLAQPVTVKSIPVPARAEFKGHFAIEPLQLKPVINPKPKQPRWTPFTRTSTLMTFRAKVATEKVQIQAKGGPVTFSDQDLEALAKALPRSRGKIELVVKPSLRGPAALLANASPFLDDMDDDIKVISELLTKLADYLLRNERHSVEIVVQQEFLTAVSELLKQSQETRKFTSKILIDPNAVANVDHSGSKHEAEICLTDLENEINCGLTGMCGSVIGTKAASIISKQLAAACNLLFRSYCTNVTTLRELTEVKVQTGAARLTLL